MADMTREEAIIRIKGLYGNGYAEQEQALEMAISDMKRVEELEKKNLTLKESLTNTLKTNEGYRSELKHFKNTSKDLEAENKRLKDGIANFKAEVEKEKGFINVPQDDCIFPKKVDIIMFYKLQNIINKYLGEVEHENEK